MKILLATRNPNKLLEVRQILEVQPGSEGIEIVGPDSLGMRETPDERDIEAFGTFEENAMAKARWFGERSGLPSLADDSGLEVDLLGGRPGVHSRRFAPIATGEPEPSDQDERNIHHLLEALGDAPLARRTSRFVCVAALWLPDDYTVQEAGREHTRRGEAEGLILGRPRGWGGFGYDPVFLDRATGRTYAELTTSEKRARSHRGKAFRAIAPLVRSCVRREGGR